MQRRSEMTLMRAVGAGSVEEGALRRRLVLKHQALRGLAVGGKARLSHWRCGEVFERLARWLTSEMRSRYFREEKGSALSVRIIERADEAAEDCRVALKTPNKALEPTPVSVTTRAGARVAPATVVAHL